jgi:hypothetical protein
MANIIIQAKFYLTQTQNSKGFIHEKLEKISRCLCVEKKSLWKIFSFSFSLSHLNFTLNPVLFSFSNIDEKNSNQ